MEPDLRYDVLSKDAVARSPDFVAVPGQPVVTGTTYVFGASESQPVAEDTIVPLFPEDAEYFDPDYRPDASPPPLRGRVRFRLDEVAKRRGLVNQKGAFRGQANLSAVQRGTGLAYSTLFKILRAPGELTGVSFDVLTRLCEFLHCTPGDLLVWEPRAEEPQIGISDYFQRKERRMAEVDDA